MIGSDYDTFGYEDKVKELKFDGSSNKSNFVYDLKGFVF
jgi:hypothetical protein